jgi:alkanesulfonate monooxygenase SsuD/methylene tetrahydromethanopterin reductase-like flavin-dependent oxidoreductase (luciferase family)
VGRDVRALEGPDGPREQLIGSPETVAERVQWFVDAGFNHIIPQTVVPGTPVQVQRRWAERFAREVAPRFSSAFTSQGAR